MDVACFRSVEKGLFESHRGHRATRNTGTTRAWTAWTIWGCAAGSVADPEDMDT